MGLFSAMHNTPSTGFLLAEMRCVNVDVMSPHPDDLPEFVEAGFPFTSMYIHVGNTVKILQGDWASHLARVLEIQNEHLVVSLLNNSMELVDASLNLTINVNEVVREFRAGDSVVVRLGKDVGKTGVVVNIKVEKPSEPKGTLLVVQGYGISDQVCNILIFCINILTRPSSTFQYRTWTQMILGGIPSSMPKRFQSLSWGAWKKGPSCMYSTGNRRGRLDY